MVYLAAISVAAVLFFLLATARGWIAASYVSCLIATCVVPFAVTGSISSGHVGIIDGTPRIYVYSVAIILGALLCLGSPHLRWVPKSVWLFVPVLLIWAVLVWDGSSAEWAGVLHFTVATAAWILAVVFGTQASQNRRLERLLGTTLLIILLVELVIGAAQVVGISIPFYGQGAFAGSLFRVSGTLGHPGNLGKALLLLLILALPMTKSSDAVTRRLGLVSISLVVALTGLTLGRANIIAVLTTIFIWLLLDRQYKMGTKIRAVLVVVAIAAPFFQAFLSRFEVDPSGGERPELTTEALIQIGRTPLLGTGPNNYVDIVGQFGPATAAGFPVHNSFLLALAELGFVLAILLFIPFVSTTWRGLRTLTRAHSSDFYGRAILAATPGVVVTAYTGWGLLSQSLLGVWILTYGYSLGQSMATSRRARISGLDSTTDAPNHEPPSRRLLKR